MPRLSSRHGVVGACVAATVLAALGAAACGDDGASAADEREVTGVVRQVQRLFVQGDVDGVCARLTREAQRQPGYMAHGSPTTCRRDVRRAFDLIRKGSGWRHSGEPEVTDVEVDGDTAVATVALGRWRDDLPLVRAGGSWKLDTFIGTATRQAKQIAAGIRGVPFPAAGSTAVSVSDATGSPCFSLFAGDYPTVSGTCEFRTFPDEFTVEILSAFGDFEFDDCRFSYRAHVDDVGRTWTDAVRFAGPRETTTCGDVYACRNANDRPLPWKGRLRSDGDDGLLHEMDACLETCVGFFTGKLRMRMVRQGGKWRTSPGKITAGESGFRIDGPLAGGRPYEVGLRTSS